MMWPVHAGGSNANGAPNAARSRTISTAPRVNFSPNSTGGHRSRRCLPGGVGVEYVVHPAETEPMALSEALALHRKASLEDVQPRRYGPIRADAGWPGTWKRLPVSVTLVPSTLRIEKSWVR